MTPVINTTFEVLFKKSVLKAMSYGVGVFISELIIRFCFAPQDQDPKREFPRSYVNELTREAVFADRKRAELQKIWPQLFFEMVQSAITDMSDMNSYKKRCMEELERT